jgi:hypothetical protein
MCIVVIIVFLFLYLNSKNVFYIFNKNIEPIDKTVDIVVSRYNEDITWLNQDKISKYPVYLYNKGPNMYDGQINNLKKYEKLKNVGRESHTYLYHIINNYDNLSDVTVFLPGSTYSTNYNKGKRTNMLFDILETVDSSIIIGAYHSNSVQKDLYNFKLDDYQSTTDENKKINPGLKLEPARIRPYGKWYYNKFNDIKTYYIPYSGIIAISKKDILQKPKSYYKSLLDELSYSSNPEVGHYFERSWEAIFYPLHKARYVDTSYLF